MRMKHKLSVWVLFTLAVFAALLVTGCVTTTSRESTNAKNFGEHIRTPVKDFVTVGLVFTENQLIEGVRGSNNDQVFTYQALLKEAESLGADAIINVVIDKKVQVVRKLFSTRSTTTWYGSALAIKYTDTLTETGSVTITADGKTTVTTATSVYFNDGGDAKTTAATVVQPSAGASTTTVTTSVNLTDSGVTKTTADTAAQPSAEAQPPAPPARGIKQGQ